MKVKFWKHTPVVLFALPAVIITSMVFIIVGSILIKSLWLMLITGSILLISFLLILLFDKRLLSKVTFNNEGILVTWFKKDIMFISWDNINEIRGTPYSRTSIYFSFVANNKQIDVDPTKKMYETIMILCPFPNLKVMLNEIDRIECFKGK